MGDPGFRLRWIVCTNGAASRPPLTMKCACRMSASRGTRELKARGSSSSRGLTATTFASGTREPVGASSVTRWPCAASPRTSATTTRWGPPYPVAGSGWLDATTTCTRTSLREVQPAQPEQRPAQPGERHAIVDSYACEAEGICPSRVHAAPGDDGRFVPRLAGQRPHHDVLLSVRIAENGDWRVEQSRQRCSGRGELFERPLRWDHRERCMRPGVRFEADPGGLHLRNLGRTEQRFARGGWVPGVGLAD